MSKIVNYKTGRTVDRTDYVDDTVGDLYRRSLVESSVLPCIYSGLDVTAGSGLNAIVSPGAARGHDIAFTINGATTEPLPTIVTLPNVSTVPLPANSTGWLVLNVNIWDSGTNTAGPNNNANLYEIEATTSATLPPSTFAPMFVTSLQPAPASVWPYTQIVLCKIVTGASSISSTDFSYPANRHFDFSKVLPNYYSLQGMAYQSPSAVAITGGTIDDTVVGGITPAPAFFTKAVDSGAAPTLPAQLTNKNYVDPKFVGNVETTGACWTLPGGFKIQMFHVVFPTGGTIVSSLVTFPIPFTDINYFIWPVTQNKANSGFGFTSIPSIMPGTKNLNNCTIEFDSDYGGYPTDIHQDTVIIAMGI